MCERGPGLCDYCDNNTTGEHCEQCKAGHYGDPSKLDGRCCCKLFFIKKWGLMGIDANL